jgi:hypothetical protein
MEIPDSIFDPLREILQLGGVRLLQLLTRLHHTKLHGLINYKDAKTKCRHLNKN